MPLYLQIKHNPFTTIFITIVVYILNSSFSYAQESQIESEQTKINSNTKKSNPAGSLTTGSKLETIFTEPVNQLKQRQQDIKYYHQATAEIRPLLVGTDEYITLIKNQTSANNRGVMILLPDWQQGVNNPKAMNYLRNKLPALGWNTIAIQSDNKPNNYPSTALSPVDQAKDNKLNITAYKNKLSALLNAVMNTAKQYSGIVVVIAQGNNAAMLVELYEIKSTEAPEALVMLSSFRESSPNFINDINTEFARQLAQSDIPTLDLYLRYDNPTVLAKAKQRKIFAEQAIKVNYRQRQLNNTATGYFPKKELVKQITGWLKVIEH
jgi:hypothetical protein